MIGNDQSDIDIPENMPSLCANFSPVFKNTLASRNDISDIMENYVQGEGMSKARKSSLSIIKLLNGRVIIRFRCNICN